VMTPAAINRLSYGGEESEEFQRIGLALIIAARRLRDFPT
jgi:hypothetical protein